MASRANLVPSGEVGLLIGSGVFLGGLHGNMNGLEGQVSEERSAIAELAVDE